MNIHCSLSLLRLLKSSSSISLSACGVTVPFLHNFSHFSLFIIKWWSRCLPMNQLLCSNSVATDICIARSRTYTEVQWLLISDLVNYAAIIFMTFKAYLKIRCMNRLVLSSIRRASTLLLRPNHISHRFVRRCKAFNTRWGSLPLRLWSSLSRRNRKYRNTKQTKANRWRHNNPLELSWWSGPVGAYNNPHYSQHYCSSRNGLMAKGTPFSLPYTSIPAVWGNQKTDPAPVILLRGEYPHNSQHYCSFRQGLMAKGTPFSLRHTSILAVWRNQRTDPDIKWPWRHVFGWDVSKDGRAQALARFWVWKVLLL